MASSIILRQSGDFKYEDSGEKLNNKARCRTAAFGEKDNLYGSSKKALKRVAISFLRKLEATTDTLYACYKNKQFYQRLTKLICPHPVPATARDSCSAIATAGKLLKSKRRCSIRLTYIQRQTKCCR